MNIYDFRPVPFYFINTVDPEDLRRTAIMKSMKKLKRNGFGGCVVFNKPPDGFSQEEYLSDKWFEMVENFALAGRELKMQVWINDGFDFPPGDAGGRIQKLAPSLKQRRLAAVGENGFEIREVEWGFPAFEEPESSLLFIELVYEEYYKRLGEYFGSGISGFFSDTDCRRINAHIIGQLNGETYFPWSRGFSAAFRKQYGYEIEPHLGDIVRRRGEASVRHDYWRLAGELYIAWFRGNYQWCREHGVLYSFHSSDTGPFTLERCPRSSIFAEGSFLQQAEFCDYPGTDHELLALDGGTHFDSRYYIASASWGGSAANTRTPDFNITRWDLRAKYTSSAAYLYGRQRALCEAFAATNWGATHQDLRRIAAWQIMQGINFFVPHAVHHKFHGPTRYFAPPEFMSGSLRHGLREFNDALTRLCFVASQGELADPVAVLDPTESVWSGKNHCLFELADKLNRMPVNYIIADKSALQKEPGRFKYLILPGIELDTGLRRLLNENGCTVLNADEPARLPLPDISFDGGEIHYMRRRLAGGTEMLLAANIWSDNSLAGALHFAGKVFHVELAPGEIAVLGGPWENFHSTDNPLPRVKLSAIKHIEWESDNIIPLPVPEKFTLHNTRRLKRIHFLIPEKGKLLLDGGELEDWETIEFLGERYRKTGIPTLSSGTHLLETLRCSDTCAMAYLCGDFAAEIKSGKEFFRKHMDYYNLELYLSEKPEIFLAPRPHTLQLGDWSRLGAPFYSGTATYITEIRDSGGKAKLALGKILGVCSVKLNGKQLGKRIWEPFEYDLELRKGINILEITVSNTMANLLDCYQAGGGLPLTTEVPAEAIC